MKRVTPPPSLLWRPSIWLLALSGALCGAASTSCSRSILGTTLLLGASVLLAYMASTLRLWQWDMRRYWRDNLGCMMSAATLDMQANINSVDSSSLDAFEKWRDKMWSSYAKVFKWDKQINNDWTQETIQAPRAREDNEDNNDMHVPIIIYRPRLHTLAAQGQDEKIVLPLVLSIHGGGMVIGTAEDPFLTKYFGFPLFRELRGRAIIASVDYRLAPRHPFPAAVNDCLAAARFLIENARTLGSARDLVSVLGASAGGNLTAVVTQTMANEGIPLRFSAVLMPMISFGATTESYISNVNGSIGLDAHSMIRMWYLYAQGASIANPNLCPLVGDLSKIRHPVFVSTHVCDPLRDEGIAYARALIRAGVKVKHLSIQGSHVWGMLGDKQGAAQLLKEIVHGVCGDNPNAKPHAIKAGASVKAVGLLPTFHATRRSLTNEITAAQVAAVNGDEIDQLI